MTRGVAMARKEVMPWWRWVALRPVSPARADSEESERARRPLLVRADRRMVVVVAWARRNMIVRDCETEMRMCEERGEGVVESSAKRACWRPASLHK